MGSVEDVYVDREQREARLLVVSAGGLLGVGKKHFLVPVQEVKRDLDGARVTVEHPKGRLRSRQSSTLTRGGSRTTFSPLRWQSSRAGRLCLWLLISLDPG